MMLFQQLSETGSSYRRGKRFKKKRGKTKTAILHSGPCGHYYHRGHPEIASARAIVHLNHICMNIGVCHVFRKDEKGANALKNLQ
jgi:hypothetical protein